MTELDDMGNIGDYEITNAEHPQLFGKWEVHHKEKYIGRGKNKGEIRKLISDHQRPYKYITGYLAYRGQALKFRLCARTYKEAALKTDLKLHHLKTYCNIEMQNGEYFEEVYVTPSGGTSTEILSTRGESEYEYARRVIDKHMRNKMAVLRSKLNPLTGRKNLTVAVLKSHGEKLKFKTLDIFINESDLRTVMEIGKLLSNYRVAFSRLRTDIICPEDPLSKLNITEYVDVTEFGFTVYITSDENHLDFLQTELIPFETLKK